MHSIACFVTLAIWSAFGFYGFCTTYYKLLTWFVRHVIPPRTKPLTDYQQGWLAGCLDCAKSIEAGNGVPDLPWGKEMK